MASRVGRFLGHPNPELKPAGAPGERGHAIHGIVLTGVLRRRINFGECCCTAGQSRRHGNVQTRYQAARCSGVTPGGY